MIDKNPRFKLIHSDWTFATGHKIYVDTKTGVNYFWHSEGNAGGLTVMLKPDGTPVVSQPSEWMDD